MTLTRWGGSTLIYEGLGKSSNRFTLKEKHTMTKLSPLGQSSTNIMPHFFLFKITLICLRLQFYCISDRLDDIPDVLGPLSAAKKLFFNLLLGQVSSLCRTGFKIEFNRFFLLCFRFCNNLSFVKSFIDHKILLWEKW